MKLVYVSHPYTGNEKRNVKSARQYCRWLKMQHQDWIIINPLDNNKFMHKCNYEHQDYMQVDLTIIERCCDIVVMCDDWKSSVGCMQEYAKAREVGCEIYYCKANSYFEREFIMNQNYSLVKVERI